MKLGLTGKVAVVPASSSGLGRAIAFSLAREGAQVAVCSRRQSAADEVAVEIRRLGGDAFAVAADLSVAADIERFVDTAIEKFNGIDILVTNAGGPPPGGFEWLSDVEWQNAFELTVMSAVRLIRHALPSMKARGGGSIVCLSSASVKQPIPNLMASNVMRAGVAGLAKALSDELANDNIRVNSVIPGRIKTPRTAQLDLANVRRTGMSPAEYAAHDLERIPMKRYGTPEEFADAVVFLASERAEYITGATLQVDGGMIRSLT